MAASIGFPEQFGAIQRPEQSRPSSDSVGQPAGASFGEEMERVLGEINHAQNQAEVQSQAFAAGTSNDIHGTMMAVEQAEISLRLLSNVRNRVVEMYREIMRMGS